MNHETLQRVKQANPWPDTRPTPEWVWNATQTLDDIKRRTRQQPATPKLPIRFDPIVALVAAVVVLVLIGGAALLFGWSGEEPPADSVVPTSVPAPPPTDPTPELSDYDIPLTVIAETVRPSSIGDGYWTVYEGAWTEALDAQFGGGSESDPSLIQPLFSGDGIVTRASGDPLGTADGVTLTYWSVSVDWVETTLEYLGEDLREQSDNGDLLATFPYEEGVFEIVLFETKDDAVGYGTGQREFMPGVSGEVVARFALSSFEDDGRWTVHVVDADLGDPVGSITSHVPFDGWYAGNIFTSSRANDIEMVHPEWADRDYAAGYNAFNAPSVVIDDVFFVYVETHGDSFTGYEVWRSTDGKEWENLGPPSGWPDRYRADVITQSEGTLLTVAWIEQQQGSSSLALRSEDGVTWSAVTGLPRYDGNFHTVDAGWIWTSSEFGMVMFTSPDGAIWEKVDTTDIPGLPPAGDGAVHSGQWSSGNTIFMLYWVDSPNQSRLWVVQFP